ncbi:16S rRNA (uracil(1498)-N(3))-methyltransferase [Sulfuricystis multivorans]|uniref:16S rRNA (uracil(1498)-N(3))-methyltransferase n=1 Tax=Sulfuricystis multivorans TaxID=2211108 RepID=UPI000F83BE1D|nr:16S rRNA (uracil(1498)-N(3))-methyltransferase [Sulfuricystis multivorans]
MIPRFHCPPPLAPGALVELPETVCHHALRVLRMRNGDRLILFDGNGGEWQATLKVGAGGTAQALLGEFDPIERESPLQVTLAQALPAGDKMDWIVEKCVELGVAAIQPLAAKRSVMRLSLERMARRVQHWNAIAAAACEQCGRNRVPIVAPVLDLHQYLATAQAQNACRLLLAPQGEDTLRSLARPTAPIVVMVGPEGGWDDGEIIAAQAAGFARVRLGPRVLRTETAGAALLAALQALWGDF